MCWSVSSSHGYGDGAKRELPSSALEAEMMPSEELDDDDRGTNFRILKASSFDNCASATKDRHCR